MKFEDAFREAPLIAILRGITPPEVRLVGEALHRGGVRIVEVPMNSPDALQSIRILAKEFSGRTVCGAGTVVNADWVDEIVAAGGEIIVAPNTDHDVIQRALARGLVPMPGFATASEAFVAYGAGARHLKLFPAVSFGTTYLKQL